MTMLFTRSMCVVSVLLAAAGEDSCPAGGGAKCTGAPVSGAATKNRSGTAQAQPTADLITQELDQLKAFVQLCDERIELLQDLKGVVETGVNISLPDSHSRILKEKLPLMSAIAGDEDKAPTGSADDYLISKAVISQETPVRFIRFLPLRNPRSGGGSSNSPAQTSMPTVLLVAVETEGSVRLFSASGELLLTFSSGHEQPVTHLAVSQGQDEYIVMTADAGGVIRVHKVNVRQRRLTKEQRQSRRNSTDEKVSQFLGAQVNVTAQYQKQMQVPSSSDGGPAKLTSMVMTNTQGSKYYVVGDEEGKIGVFSKNGSFLASIDASTTPGAKVEGLYSHLSQLIFRTDFEWGYVDVNKHKVQRIQCPDFDGRVKAVAFDSQQASRLLVSDEDGTVWVFNLKERNNCKLDHRFPKGATIGPVQLASIKGFAVALERTERNGDAASVLSLNMSHVGRRKEALAGAPSAVVWRKGRQAVRDWSMHKRYQAGDLLAFLSEDGREIEIMELLMHVYTAPSTSDPFGNMGKMPVIGIAVILVLGYQYMKSNKGGKMGKGGSKFDNMDFSALKNKRGLGGGGLGGLGALKGRGGRGGLGGLRR